MSALKIVVPVEMTDAKLASSDVPDNTPAAYDAGTSYSIGTRVRDQNKIWESAQNDNEGNSPSSSPAHWLYVSATNRWAIFDLEQVTRTAQANSMQYVIHPEEEVTAVRTMGLHHVDSVQVQFFEDVSDVTPIYDSGQSAAGLLPNSADWWAYCFGPWSVVDQTGFEIPNTATNPKIQVDYVGASTMSVGVLLVGQEHVFGTRNWEGVQNGVRIRNDRRTRFTDNEFDIPTLTKKAVMSTVTFTLLVGCDVVDVLMDFYRDYGDKVCFFEVSDLWRTTQVLGLISSFELTLQGATYSEFSIEIRGVPQQ